MLKGVLDKKISFNKNINKYLDSCLKCGACTKFCPSGIDIVDILTSAKHEAFKNSHFEKLKSFLLKFLIFEFLFKIPKLFKRKIKSKTFEKKVIFFGGCTQNFNSADKIIKLFNKQNIEVITPDFNCCGITFLMNGDFESFEKYQNDFIKKIEKYETPEIIVTCASCEKTLKDYIKFNPNNQRLQNLKVKNIFEYIKDNGIIFELKKKMSVTFHKPCNLENYEDIKWILNNTKNLTYVEMNDIDLCCGMNGFTKLTNLKILKELITKKRKNILDTKTKKVLTSCLGCEIVLKFGALNSYKVEDLTQFLLKNSM